MKFRAVIHDQQLMREFLNTILTLSKLTKECVMNISEENVNFVINEESASVAPLVWIDINSSTYFDEYKMEGVDENYPNILLSFNPANLARALSVLRGAVTFVKMKLTNKQFPCITVEIELPSATSVQNRRIVHDVPVNVIPRRDWSAYRMPRIPDPNIILTMPSLKFLRNLVDKVKNISPSITFCATSLGELSIIAETESATIASHYRNLEIKKIDKSQMSDGGGNDVEASCLVDCKKAAIFLSALQMSNVELSCGIVQDHAIQMEVNVRRGLVINCIFPAVCL